MEEAADGCLCEIALEHPHPPCSVLKLIQIFLSCEKIFLALVFLEPSMLYLVTIEALDLAK